MTERSRLDAAHEEQAASGGEWFRSPVALGAGALLFLGVLAGIVLAVTGGGDSSSSDVAEPVEVTPISFGGIDIPEIDAVTIDGDLLPPPPAPGEPDPAVGTLMPTITATSLANGSPITLGPGQARVIGFFAHWCPHCQAELPEVTAWLADTQLPPNAEFVAVSTAVDETRGNYPPSKWFTDVGFSSPVVVDDGAELLNGLGFSGFPAFVAVDASGAIVARAGGNIGTEGLAELFANFAS